jgi:hypothetical protein
MLSVPAIEYGDQDFCLPPERSLLWLDDTTRLDNLVGALANPDPIHSCATVIYNYVGPKLYLGQTPGFNSLYFSIVYANSFDKCEKGQKSKKF